MCPAIYTMRRITDSPTWDPSFPVPFIHRRLIERMPSCPKTQMRFLSQWFCRILRVTQLFKLVAEFAWVLETGFGDRPLSVVSARDIHRTSPECSQGSVVRVPQYSSYFVGIPSIFLSILLYLGSVHSVFINILS